MRPKTNFSQVNSLLVHLVIIDDPIFTFLCVEIAKNLFQNQSKISEEGRKSKKKNNNILLIQ